MSHFHVTANVPGFKPEDDTYCLDSVDDAAKAMKVEITNLGLDTGEGCDRDGCNVCGWCRKGNTILRSTTGETMSRIVRLELAMFGESSWAFDVPCAPEYTFRAVSVAGDRSECDHRP